MTRAVTEPDGAPLANFTGQDLEATLNHALRMLCIFTAIGIAVTWRVAGWQSALLFAVGAAIAATGLYESRRLMLAVLSRFDDGTSKRPIAGVLIWFFLRLILAGVVLYASLRSLQGSVYALCAGLGLAVVTLMIESVRLLRAWTL